MRLTENNRELNRHTISAFTTNYVMYLHRQTGKPLYELGVPFVWTPVGNREGDVKIIPSMLVLASDQKTILVCSPNTNPTPIKEVPYIFTEFSEASHFLSERNLIPEYSDESEISNVGRCERVVYLPNVDDIFEDKENKDEDEDEIEVDIEVVMVMAIKLLARLIAKM